ncbi:hypothetical protein IK146_02940 [Candidatus Saccharibacteria bacterium]|nr:hypothetical protein [Candidatus Saccharibacteria bacterium]
MNSLKSLLAWKMDPLKLLVWHYHGLMKSAHTETTDAKVRNLRDAFESMGLVGRGYLTFGQKAAILVVFLALELGLAILFSYVATWIWPNIDRTATFAILAVAIAIVMDILCYDRVRDAIGNAVGKNRYKRIDQWLDTGIWA